MAPTLLAAAESTTPIPLLWALPFVLLLACIAICPLFLSKFWEHHYPKVAVGLGLLVAIFYVFVRRQPGELLAEMKEYVSFIVLLGSLYIVSGGVLIRIHRAGTPFVNLSLLLFGALLANVVGTTGASMLLIRPFLRMNKAHLKPYHVVFFIFIVSNVGGALTPIGDPPLFLGYLQGVPFLWVFEHCNMVWAMAIAILSIIFLIIDSLDHRRAPRPAHDHDPGATLHLGGIHNFILTAVIVLGVFQPGTFEIVHLMNEQGMSVKLLGKLLLSREILMIAAAVASRLVTSPEIYKRNEFSYGSIKEVAILFLGIFATMTPALGWLEENATRLPIKTPGNFYFMSGGLSSVLDNAPTYLTFLEVKLGRLEPRQVHALMAINPDLSYREAAIKQLTTDANLNLSLIAVSLGSVFFGAMTYIGNGPNFMVKSIADRHGAVTPNFLEYIFKYSLPILLPVLILVWYVFLRG